MHRAVRLMCLICGLSSLAAARPTPPAPSAIDPVVSRLEAAVNALERLAASGRVDDGEVAALRASIDALAVEVRALRGSTTSSASASTSAGSASDLERRLDELDARLDETGDALFRELSERLTFSGSTTGAFVVPEAGDSFLHFFRLSLMGNAQIARRLRFYTKVELVEAAQVGSGNPLDGLISVEQAYLDLFIHDALTIRTGAIVAPFGSYNRQNEEWRHPFHFPPLVSLFVFPGKYSDAGLELQGRFNLGESVLFLYQAAVVNGLTHDIGAGLGIAGGLGAGVGLRGARPKYIRDNNGNKAGVGRLALVVGTNFEVGGSGYYGEYADAGAGDAALWMTGLDARLEVGPLITRAEGVYIHVDPGFRDVDTDADPLTPPVRFPFPTALMGVVAEAELQFWPAALDGTFLGDFDDPKLMVGARFDAVRAIFPEELRGYLLSATVGWRPVHRSRLSIEVARQFAQLGLGPRTLVAVAIEIGF